MADSPKAPLTNKPGVTNWVERFHALPKGSWIRRAAEHIKAKGKPESLAIPYAVRAAERVCATGDTSLPGLQQVNPKSRAEACAALAIWKKAAAQAKASDLTTRADVRAIDLAGAFIAYSEGWSDHLPTGATGAYLDLAAETGETVDLAFDEAKHPRGVDGRWIRAVFREELRRALKDIKPNVHGVGRSDKPHYSRQQLAAAKGIARKRTLKRVDEAARKVGDVARAAVLPKRVSSRAMVLAALRQDVIDLAAKR